MNPDIARYKAMLSWNRLYVRGGTISEQLKKRNIKSIVVYGATEIAELFIDQAINEGVCIAGICDERIIKLGSFYGTIPMVRNEDLIGIDTTVIITAMGFAEEIRSELQSINVKSITIRELMEESEEEDA